jgi:hypothetical protein
MAYNSSENPAFAAVKDVLDRYGLGELSNWAWEQIVAGASPEQTIQSLREQDSYKARFAGIIERQKKGLPPMSEEEYIEWETRAGEIMHFYGLPIGFYDDPQDFSNMIGGDVSLRELEGRVVIARDAAQNAPADVVQILADQYGIDAGGLTAFYLDPDRALPTLERQFAAGQIMAQDQRRDFGFKSISMNEAENIVREGVDPEDTRTSLGALEAGQELMHDLSGQGGGSRFSRQDYLNYLKGDEMAARKLERTGRERVSGHRGGDTGGFAGGQQGFTGVGTAGSGG